MCVSTIYKNKHVFSLALWKAHYKTQHKAKTKLPEVHFLIKSYHLFISSCEYVFCTVIYNNITSRI